MSVYSALAYKNKRLSDFHHRLYVYLWAYQERVEDDVSHAAMAEALSVLGSTLDASDIAEALGLLAELDLIEPHHMGAWRLAAMSWTREPRTFEVEET